MAIFGSIGGDHVRAVAPAEPGSGRQTERLLRWMLIAMAIGLAVLFLRGLMLGVRAGIPFFAIGALTALGAASVGAALGLLFALPSSNRVVIQPNDSKSGTASETSSASSSGAPAVQGSSRTSWYTDNTSLEQIAQWLTTAIVTLLLTNWWSIANQFDRLAAATSLAMSGASIAGPVSDAAKVPGGVLMAAYLVLGFLLAYVWSRRYFLKELYDARQEVEKIQRVFEREFDTAKEEQRVQIAPKGQQDTQKAAAAVSEVERSDFVGTAAGLPAPIAPGPVDGDPWKNQFGGVAAAGGVELIAVVRETPGDNEWFEVNISVRGIDPTSRQTRAGQPLRIYLHPSFDNPIRTMSFDAAGEANLTLIAYGAFTVGTQLIDQLLELDLAFLPSAPATFRSR